MLNEHIYTIMNDNNMYEDLVEVLNSEFKSVNLFYKVNSFIKSIEFLSQNQSFLDNNIFIIFAEYSFINEISKYTNENLDTSNYILVSVSNKHHPSISSLENVFDSLIMQESEFNSSFFIKRLKSEVSNKNRISLLKLEMREFYEIGKQLSSEKDTLKLFEAIACSSLKMTSSDAVSVFLIVDAATGIWSTLGNEDYNSKMLKFVISRNMSITVDFEENGFLPITRKSIAGYNAISGKTIRIDDANSINPIIGYQHNKSFDDKTGYITKSILSVPMKDHKSRVTGIIQLINKKKNKSPIDFSNEQSFKNIISYTYTDELIMNSVAGQAAVALENNLLYRDMENLLHEYKLQNDKLSYLSNKVLKAHEEERKRIAREIHDGPAQSSACLAIKVELCKRLLSKNNFIGLDTELNKLGTDIRLNVKDIRNIIYDLKPSYLEDGLIEALKNHISIFNKNNNLQVNLECIGKDDKIEYYLVSTLYRVVQEALSNCFKHSNASLVTITINISDSKILLVVSDNGIGFDSSILKSCNHQLDSGFGLEGMVERIELTGGTICINSEQNEGTTIEVKIPLI